MGGKKFKKSLGSKKSEGSDHLRISPNLHFKKSVGSDLNKKTLNRTALNIRCDMYVFLACGKDD